MPWRPTLEMSAATIAVAVVLISLTSVGHVGEQSQ
jgi:hypothetical protein